MQAGAQSITSICPSLVLPFLERFRLSYFNCHPGDAIAHNCTSCLFSIPASPSSQSALPILLPSPGSAQVLPERSRASAGSGFPSRQSTNCSSPCTPNAQSKALQQALTRARPDLRAGSTGCCYYSKHLHFQTLTARRLFLRFIRRQRGGNSCILDTL